MFMRAILFFVAAAPDLQASIQYFEEATCVVLNIDIHAMGWYSYTNLMADYKYVTTILGIKVSLSK